MRRCFDFQHKFRPRYGARVCSRSARPGEPCSTGISANLNVSADRRGLLRRKFHIEITPRTKAALLSSSPARRSATSRSAARAAIRFEGADRRERSDRRRAAPGPAGQGKDDSRCSRVGRRKTRKPRRIEDDARIKHDALTRKRNFQRAPSPHWRAPLALDKQREQEIVDQTSTISHARSAISSAARARAPAFALFASESSAA